MVLPQTHWIMKAQAVLRRAACTVTSTRLWSINIDYKCFDWTVLHLLPPLLFFKCWGSPHRYFTAFLWGAPNAPISALLTYALAGADCSPSGSSHLPTGSSSCESENTNGCVNELSAVELAAPKGSILKAHCGDRWSPPQSPGPSKANAKIIKSQAKSPRLVGVEFRDSERWSSPETFFQVAGGRRRSLGRHQGQGCSPTGRLLAQHALKPCFHLRHSIHQAWWCVPVIPALRRWRLED